MAFITTKGRYAIRVLIDLSENRERGCIPLKEIAERQEISQKYLESIMALLVKAEVVAGTHGKGGGYQLIIPPEECSVGMVLRVTEGPVTPVACIGEDGVHCDRAGTCTTLPLWLKLDNMINEYLDTITIKDLIDGSGTHGNIIVPQ